MYAKGLAEGMEAMQAALSDNPKAYKSFLKDQVQGAISSAGLNTDNLKSLLVVPLTDMKR